MKTIMKMFILFAVLSTGALADECRDAVELQSMDILAQDIGVSYDEVYREYQITLTKTQELVDGVEKYEALFNTYVGIFKVKMDVNYYCDVIESSTSQRY